MKNSTVNIVSSQILYLVEKEVLFVAFLSGLTSVCCLIIQTGWYAWKIFSNVTIEDHTKHWILTKNPVIQLALIELLCEKNQDSTLPFPNYRIINNDKTLNFEKSPFYYIENWHLS